MSKSKVIGVEEWSKQLDALGKEADGICKMAVYNGAKAVADEVKAAIGTIPVYDPKTDRHPCGATAAEKAGLLSGMGIARMQSSGEGWDTTIGFDGYNSEKTEKYPKGHPNSMIARAINSGTSWLRKYPFITRAFSSSKGAAEAAMAETIETEVQRRLE